MSNINEDNLVIIGRVGAVYGVNGWVKIRSYTMPRDNILHYSPWLVKLNGKWESIKLEGGRPHGPTFVAKFPDIHDRNAALTLTNADIAVPRDQLPALPQGEFYCRDLEGLTVVNDAGTVYGTVDEVMETGANDVLVVKGEKSMLIPFLLDESILDVNLQTKTIKVDWDPEF